MKKTNSCIRALALCAAVFFALGACDSSGGSGDSGDPDNSGDPSNPGVVDENVYIGGAYATASGVVTPCYWKGMDYTALTIPAGTDFSCLTDIQVVDGTVHSVGYGGIGDPEDSEDETAWYWKDKVPTALPIDEGGNDAYALSIFVVGSDVYAAGHYERAGGKEAACYWKNGSRTDLSPASEDSRAFGICVAGGKVYVAGINKDKKACYWLDEVQTVLESPAASTSSEANFVTVLNGVVYIGGSYEKEDGEEELDFPCYWIDGTLTALTLDTKNTYSAYNTFVEDGTVYTSGNYGTGTKDENGDGGVYKPCYWKATARTDISVPESEYGNLIYDLSVSGGTVYTMGWYNPTLKDEVACCWIGDKRAKLIVPDGSRGSRAYCIFID